MTSEEGIPYWENEDVMDFDETESSDNVGSSLCTPKRKKLYTEDEDKKIVEHIIKNNAFSKVKGRKLYQDMQTEQVVGSRNWASLHERMKKYIAPDISRNPERYGVTKEDAKKFPVTPKRDTATPKPTPKTRGERITIEDAKSLVDVVMEFKEPMRPMGKLYWQSVIDTKHEKLPSKQPERLLSIYRKYLSSKDEKSLSMVITDKETLLKFMSKVRGQSYEEPNGTDTEAENEKHSKEDASKSNDDLDDQEENANDQKVYKNSLAAGRKISEIILWGSAFGNEKTKIVADAGIAIIKNLHSASLSILQTSNGK